MPNGDVDAAQRHKEAWDSVLRRVVEDEDYRRQLLQEPMETLRQSGIELEDVDEVMVFEYDPRRPILVLPPLGAEIAPEPSPDAVPHG